jgi:hypothetical protein
LGISKKMLDRLRPGLSPVVFGSRVYRYRRSDVARYLAAMATVA